MATNSLQGKQEAFNSDQVEEEEEEEEEEEDEEALSLCDLPDNLIKEEDQARKADSVVIETQEEFDFRLWGGPFSKESEMCAADEVFFRGQILPLRLSFSSDAGLITTAFKRDGQQLNRCELSRSESMDHGSMSEFRSYSSRSSSLRSQNSSSSTSSATITTSKIYKPRVRNQFHTHPSPKPQLRVSGPRQLSFGNLGRKSSAWGFFRLGVVPVPEIGLQDLKVRCTNSANKNSVSRNSSSSSSSNSTFNVNGTSEGAKMRSSSNHSNKSNHVFKQLVGKGGGLLSGCNCSIETVPLDIMIKRGTKSTNKTESTTHAMKEKVLELKKQKQRQKQGKKAMSRRRTFEWLEELSHASYPDEEALLSNS